MRHAWVTPSDAFATLTIEVESDLCSNRALAVVRPETGLSAGRVVSGGAMSTPFGGIGRPSTEEQELRRLEFLRLVVVERRPWSDAARESKINPYRALDILESDEMRVVLAAAA